MSQFVYPLDGEQNYSASQAGAFNGTRTSGVWAGDGNLAVAITGARQLTLSAGLAWFTTDAYWGKVYCNTSNVAFTLPTADEALDQICRVVIRWDKTANKAEAMLLQGDLASSPSAPERQTSDEVFDLVIADYYILHGETAADATRLTDQRLNESLCGLMSDGVTRLPTSTLYAEYEAAVAELRRAIEAAWSGEISPGAVSTRYTATIPSDTDEWSGDDPASCEVAVPGLQVSDNPIIDLVPSDTYETAEAQMSAYGGIYKAVTGAGTLTVYATEVPEVDLPIAILCVRK